MESHADKSIFSNSALRYSATRLISRGALDWNSIYAGLSFVAESFFAGDYFKASS